MLNPSDFEQAARKLDCEVAAIRAVAEVEAPRGGFLSSGEPTILFERHIFHRQTYGKYAKDYPEICNKQPGGYEGGAAEHQRLQQAVELDREAALQSASWGQFQIMGFNWRACGFESLQDFINAMYRSDQGQLEAFVGFIQSNGALVRAIQEKDWPSFAKYYNGPNYAINAYDEKMAAAYEKYA